MGKRFFFRFFRLLFKGGGVCLFKKVVYVQPNSTYIENNFENSNENLNENTDE